MLVLTRKITEEIHIGDGIVVTLLGLNGTQARIGIAAPRDIAITRPDAIFKSRKNKEESNEDKFNR